MKEKEANDYLERKRIGERLRSKREKSKYSIYKVSNILSIKSSDLEDYESGSRDAPKRILERLFKFYGKESEEIYILLTKELSKKLKKSRVNARYTLVEAANYAGISPVNLSSCEKFTTKRIRKEVCKKLENLYDTVLIDEKKSSIIDDNLLNKKEQDLGKLFKGENIDQKSKKENNIAKSSKTEVKKNQKVKSSHKKNSDHQVFLHEKEDFGEERENKIVITDDNLSQILRQIREKRRFTVTRAANHIGVSCCTLGNYEKNKIKTISPSRLKKLADLYEDDDLKKYLQKNKGLLKEQEICIIDEKIKNELITLRKNIGCSLKKIADMVHMTPSGILDYEIGKIKTISIGKLRKLRKAYEKIEKEINEKSKSKTVEQKLGDKLRLSRKKIGLTQAEVSEKLGIVKSILINYERGIIKSVPIKILEQLSEIYQDNTIKNFVLSNEYLKSGGKPHLDHDKKQGEDLKAKRYKLGYTLKEVEKLLGTNAKTLAYYENGKSKKIPITLFGELEKLYSEPKKNKK